jgi:hypothetical protein
MYNTDTAPCAGICQPVEQIRETGTGYAIPARIEQGYGVPIEDAVES